MTAKYQFYLSNALAPSTRQVYGSAQCQFLDFCSQDIPSDSSHPLLAASEQTLMCFSAHLADHVHHSSIKVYLYAVRSLHIDYSYPDPLIDCLQLQRLLRGIKRHQGSNPPHCQPVTADLLTIVRKSLELTIPDNVILWATYSLGFFGFLRAGEFTTNGPFDPSLHLTVADLQVDSSTNPQSLRVFIKCKKSYPFRQGRFNFLGCGSSSLCTVAALTNYFHLRELGMGALFIFQNGCFLSQAHLSSFLQSTLQAAEIPRKFSGHSFRIEAATTAAQQGIPDHLITTMGLRSSEIYLLYVCTPVDSILSVAERIS